MPRKKKDEEVFEGFDAPEEELVTEQPEKELKPSAKRNGIVESFGLDYLFVVDDTGNGYRVIRTEKHKNIKKGDKITF